MVNLCPNGLLLSRPRNNPGRLLGAALVMMAAGTVLRFDTFLVAFMPGSNWSYFPSVSEIGVSAGLVAFEVLAYVTIVKMFPILSGRTAQ